MYEYRATVVSVYDGDTCRLDVDLGFYTQILKMGIRLAGINAPELYDGTPAGMAARDYLRSLLPVGSLVTLRTLKDKQEKYGRWLGYITNADGVNVNGDMVLAGHAVPYMVGI